MGDEGTMMMMMVVVVVVAEEDDSSLVGLMRFCAIEERKDGIITPLIHQRMALAPWSEIRKQERCHEHLGSLFHTLRQACKALDRWKIIPDLAPIG